MMLRLVWLVALSTAAPARAYTTPERVGTGSLLLRVDPTGNYRAAPTLETDVRIQVTGMIGRTRVVQKFENHTTEWQEGVYVFPLPEHAAVDRLRLRFGGRVLEGQIREREQARREYEAAKREGKRTSLLEQERPNVFTTSVAPIGPGEEVEVEMEYQEDVRYQQGSFELRFPMVVGPRYVPGRALARELEPIARFAGTGWAAPTDVVPDADRITPPVLLPGASRENAVSILVELDPGIDLARVESPSHDVRVVPHGAEGDFRRLVSPEAGAVPAVKDFVLRWTPDVSQAPRAALFRETYEGQDYVLLMLLPPHEEPGIRLPRETVFVIDTSGSMHGSSIEQARASLAMALERLRPEDRFNVVQFNSRTSQLFDLPVPADRWNVERALRYVRGLDAEGGTEMMPALAAAFSQSSSESAGRVRQVIFITDGAVGNEDQLFRAIRGGIGERRLFTVGIGSAPNGSPGPGPGRTPRPWRS